MTHPPNSRTGTVSCGPAGTIAVLLFGAAALAACDPYASPGTHVSRAPAPSAASPHGAMPAGAYFGDEYAEVQRSLTVSPDAAHTATF